MLEDWMLVALAAGALWIFWGFLQFVFDCIDYYHEKASADRRSREAMQTTRETETSGF